MILPTSDIEGIQPDPKNVEDALQAEAEAAVKSATSSKVDDSDFDEPLGQACSLDNPECESCQ